MKLTLLLLLTGCFVEVQQPADMCVRTLRPRIACETHYVWVSGRYFHGRWIDGHYIPRRNYYR